MLSNLFKLAIEKFQDNKASAPDIKNNIYSCRLAYSSLFDNMFMFGLSQIMQTTAEMNNDYNTYSNYIINSLRMNRDINDCNRPKGHTYQPSQNELNNFMFLNTMNEKTKEYIVKLCDIVLDEKYDISKETDKNIITNYRLLKFIPVYYEIMSNCYKIYDDNERFLKSNEFNNIVNKMGPSFNILKMNINGRTDFVSLISIFKENYNKPEIIELSNLILKYHAEMFKIVKYTKKQSDNEDKSKDKSKEEKPKEEKPKEAKTKEEKPKKEPKQKEPKEEAEADNTKPAKKKKEKIPAAVRKIVWNTYIGKDNSVGKCLCCDAEEISSTNFECGHIKSEKNGGEVNIDNLRPICGHCNKSIGGNNMDEFMDKYKIKKPANWNGV